MPTFFVGSHHSISIKISLPRNYPKDKADIPITFYLTDKDGNKCNCTGDAEILLIYEDDGGKKTVRSLSKLYHLTKKPRKFKFNIVMPDKPGYYTLSCSTVPGLAIGDSIHVVGGR